MITKLEGIQRTTPQTSNQYKTPHPMGSNSNKRNYILFCYLKLQKNERFWTISSRGNREAYMVLAKCWPETKSNKIIRILLNPLNSQTVRDKENPRLSHGTAKDKYKAPALPPPPPHEYFSQGRHRVNLRPGPKDTQLCSCNIWYF